MMDEKQKVFIIELLIEINDIFTALSDKLNILYFKFEPFLKDIPEDSNPSDIIYSDRDKIYKEIQVNLHNITHIINHKLTTFETFPERQKFRNLIDMNTVNIHKKLNELTGKYK